MPDSSTPSSSRFEALVRRFFQLHGFEVERLRGRAGLIEIRERHLHRGRGRAIRLALVEQDTLRQWEVPEDALGDSSEEGDGQSSRDMRLRRRAEELRPRDVDFAVIDDSPVGNLATRVGTAGTTPPRFLPVKRGAPGYLHYGQAMSFGRDLIFGEYVRHLRTQSGTEASSPLDDRTEAGAPSGEVLGSEVTHDIRFTRRLVCGHPGSGLSSELRRVHTELSKHEWEVRDDARRSFQHPTVLDALKVRNESVAQAIVAALPDEVRGLVNEALALELWRRGYLHVLLDDVDDWNIGYELDPNRGTFASFLRAAGDSGPFTVTCDKGMVFHFVRSDLVHGDDGDERLPLGELLGSARVEQLRRLKTLGQRFFADAGLELRQLVSSARSPELQGDAGTPTTERPWARTQGLVGEHEWYALLQNLSVRTCNQSSPDYLSIGEVRQAIDQHIPKSRLTVSATDLVLRALQESGVFTHDPARGLRFRDKITAEWLIAEELARAFLDLEDWSDEQRSQDSPFMRRVAQLLTMPQINERLLFRALESLGRLQSLEGVAAAEHCKGFYKTCLASVIQGGTAADSLRATALDQRELADFRCALLRLLNVLNAWLQSTGTTRLELPPGLEMEGLVARQLHLHGLDLRDANFSSANLPFVCFDGCDLRGTRLTKAFLAPAIVIECDLAGADFSGAELSAAFFARRREVEDGSSPAGNRLTKAQLAEALVWATDFSRLEAAEPGADEQWLTSLPGSGEQKDPLGSYDLQTLEACLHSFDVHRALAERDGAGERTSEETLRESFLPGHIARLQDGTLTVTRAREGGDDAAEDAVLLTIDNVATFDYTLDDAGPTFAVVGRDGTVSLGRPRDDGGLETIYQATSQEIADNRPRVKIVPGQGVVAAWLPAHMVFVRPRAGGPPEVRTFDQRGVQRGASALVCVGEGQQFLLVALDDGSLHVYDLDEARTQDTGTIPRRAGRARLLRRSANYESASPAVTVQYLERFGQLHVARQDGGLDSYFIDKEGALLRQASFFLAHRRIHRIIPTEGDKFLVSGLAKPTRENPDATSTLLALCNTRLDVLAVWPILGELGRPPGESALKDILHRRCIADADQAHRRAGPEEALDEKDLELLASAISVDPDYSVQIWGRDTDQESPISVSGGGAPDERDDVSAGRARLRLVVDRAKLPERLSQLPSLTRLLVNGEWCNLRLGLTLSCYWGSRGSEGSEDGSSTGTRNDHRNILQHELVCIEDVKNYTLLLYCEHAMLRKLKTAALKHGIRPDVAYELRDRAPIKPARLVERRFYRKVVNPFSGRIGDPVTGGDFYGHKEDIEKWTRRLLRPGSALVLTGMRRMGKTSFLRSLAHNLPAGRTIVVGFDLGPNCRQFSAFLSNVVDGLAKVLQVERSIRLEVDVVEELKETARESTPDRFYDRLFEVLEEKGQGDSILVLMLDEVGQLYAGGGGQQIYAIDREAEESLITFFQHLSELHEHQRDRVRCVFAGLPWHFRPTFSTAHTSNVWRYYNQTDRRHHLGSMPDETLRHLIKESLQSVSLDITDEALDYCLDLATGVPHDICTMMHDAVELLKQNPGQTTVEKVDLVNADGIIQENYEDYVNSFWDSLTAPAKALIARYMETNPPLWETDVLSLRRDNIGSLLKPILDMGYCDKVDKRKTVLFIPRGLTLNLYSRLEREELVTRERQPAAPGR